MLNACLRRFGVFAYAGVLAGGAVAVTWDPAPLLAQETKCFLVACTGNVCVWKEVKCPPPEPT
jgi:hypothetical protein